MNYNNQSKKMSKKTQFVQKIAISAVILGCAATSASAMLAHLKDSFRIARRLPSSSFVQRNLLDNNESTLYIAQRSYHVPVPKTDIEQYKIIIKNAFEAIPSSMIDSILKCSEKEGVDSEILTIAHSLYPETKISRQKESPITDTNQPMSNTGC